MAQVSTDRRRGINSSAAIKVACIAGSTADLTLSAEQTVDGIALVDGDRCLAKDQSDATENGIWVVATGDWTRAVDFDGSFDVAEGTLINVSRGTTNSDTYWRVTNTGTITIGTTSITFGQGLTDVAISATSTVTDESSDTTCFPIFVTDATGNVALKTGSNITFNSSTGALAVTLIDGVLGSVTPAAVTATTLTITGDFTSNSVVQPPIPAAITDHLRAGSIQLRQTNTVSSLNVHSVVTVDTWESVGPTGSGADNIWADLDVVPSTANVIICTARINIGITGVTGGLAELYGVNGDFSSPSAVLGSGQALIFVGLDDNETSGYCQIAHDVHIPCNGSQVSKLYWTEDADISSTISLHYKGFITD